MRVIKGQPQTAPRVSTRGAYPNAFKSPPAKPLSRPNRTAAWWRAYYARHKAARAAAFDRYQKSERGAEKARLKMRALYARNTVAKRQGVYSKNSKPGAKILGSQSNNIGASIALTPEHRREIPKKPLDTE